jgi:hypothetical protein
MPEILTGISESQLENANSRYLKANHPDLIEDRAMVKNGHMAVQSAETSLKQLEVVTQDFMRVFDTATTPFVV